MGILNQCGLFAFLLLWISYTTVPFHRNKYTKEGFCFIKVAQTSGTPQGAGPKAGSQPSLCAPVCRHFSLPQLSAGFRPLPSLWLGTQWRPQWESFCMLLISLFRVNEKASFCTDKSLHEFYWISKTKMFVHSLSSFHISLREEAQQNVGHNDL